MSFGQNLGKKSGGFQSWSEPGQLRVGAVNFGQILGESEAFNFCQNLVVKKKVGTLNFGQTMGKKIVGAFNSALG